jgi:hypothetical protein
MTTRRHIHIPDMTAEETDRVVDLLCELAHHLMDLRPADDDDNHGFSTMEDFERILGQPNQAET